MKRQSSRNSVKMKQQSDRKKGIGAVIDCHPSTVDDLGDSNAEVDHYQAGVADSTIACPRRKRRSSAIRDYPVGCVRPQPGQPHSSFPARKLQTEDPSDVNLPPEIPASVHQQQEFDIRDHPIAACVRSHVGRLNSNMSSSPSDQCGSTREFDPPSFQQPNVDLDPNHRPLQTDQFLSITAARSPSPRRSKARYEIQDHLTPSSESPRSENPTSMNDYQRNSQAVSSIAGRGYIRSRSGQLRKRPSAVRDYPDTRDRSVTIVYQRKRKNIQNEEEDEEIWKHSP